MDASRVITVFLIAAISSFLLPAAAEGQFALGAYLGESSTFDSDVELKLPGDTRLVFHDVSWYDESWVAPRYYGLRLTYWHRDSPWWGFGLDFTHAKFYAHLDAIVRVTGTREGEPIDTDETLGDTFRNLAMSHGHNTLTFNAFYRWLSTGSGQRLTPYVGLGVGVALPHVEVDTGDSITEEYQLAGATIQGLGGLDVRLGRGFSVFAEYRFNYARLDADLSGGGSLEVAPWTTHFSGGLTFTFR